MAMTNYMDLLMSNQPWNLIMYMVIPVVFAEAITATEFYSLFFGEKENTKWLRWNKILSFLAGLYFAVIFVYFMTHVLPGIQWRGIVDVIAVTAYLLGVIPLGAIALLDIGMWGKNLTQRQHMHKHFLLLIGFLVVSHIAMIFGMVNPEIAGWQPQHNMMQMNHSNMNHGDMNMDMDNGSDSNDSAHKTPKVHK